MNLTSLVTAAVLTFTPPVFTSPVLTRVDCQSASELFATAPKNLRETKLSGTTMVAFINGLAKVGLVNPEVSFDSVYLFADDSDDTVFVVLVNNNCITAAGWLRGAVVQQVLREANG